MRVRARDAPLLFSSRRQLSSSVVTKPADIHSGGPEGPSGNQEASESEETLSAHESGMEEEVEGE